MPSRQRPPERPPAADQATIQLRDRDATDGVQGDPRRCLITALGPLEGADTATGDAGEAIAKRERLLATIASGIAAEGKRPVICATGLSMAYLADAPFALELLPLRRDLAVLTAAEYSAYLRARHRVILAKWSVTEEITLAESFDEFLQRESALEGAPA